MKKLVFLSLLIFGQLFAAQKNIAELAPYNIHGEDSRFKVLATNTPPFSSIGYISGGCTGFLIAPNAVVTAAHCLYNFKEKKWNDFLDFSPQVKDNFHYTLGIFRWERAYLLRHFVETNDYRDDFAVVILDQSLDLPLLDLMVYDRLAVGDRIFFAGYPGDKIFLSMWASSCPVEKIGPVVDYSCDSYAGMSGAPLVLSTRPTSVFGVHIAGGIDENYGKGFDYRTIEQIKDWSRQRVGKEVIERINPIAPYRKVFMSSKCAVTQAFKIRYTDLLDRQISKGPLRIRKNETLYLADTRSSRVIIEDLSGKQYPVSLEQDARSRFVIPIPFCFDSQNSN